MRFLPLILSTFILAACGGGGGGGGGDSVGSSKLSTTQATYESLFLSPNKAYRSSSSSLPNLGVPGAGSGYYYFDAEASLAKSPLTGTQRLTPQSSNLTKTLGLPQYSTLSWYLADGEFFTSGLQQPADVSYEGSFVTETSLSEDLKHRLGSGTVTGITVTPLTGPIVSASGSALGLLPSVMYTNTSLTNPNAAWISGSAYIVNTVRLDTDVYIVNASFPSTVPGVTSEPSTPVAIATNTTINDLINANSLAVYPGGKKYGAADGAVKTVQGVPVYVANVPSAPTGSISAYQVFYGKNNNVYAGNLIKAGSVITSNSGFNAQARASIKAALTF